MRILYSFLLGILLASCLAASSQGSIVTIDTAKRYQTIEGFGFHGVHDVWWSNPNTQVNEEWTNFVIKDLGITMLRNEYYPDSEFFNQQKPALLLMKKAAEENKTPLRFIVSIWSPPAKFKCKISGDKNWWPDDAQPVDVTNSGYGLCPAKVDEFAQWLVQAIKDYQKIGIDLYAVSFQNEPCFFQPYNSSFYHISYYTEVLKKVAPVIKASFPKIKIFGAEQMLEEIDNDSNSFGFACGGQYSKAIKDDPAALAQLDVFAWHGYSDGVQATASSRMAKLWQRAHDDFGSTNKPLWMTETSGYIDDWNDEKKGPLNLAQAIYASLYYGKVSAWVWWQGSELEKVNEGALMQGMKHQGGRYYVSKNFYRYIRPGAQMVDVKSVDKDVLVNAFIDSRNGMVIVAINPTGDDLKIALEGSGIPGKLNAVCQTSTNQNCVDAGQVSSNSITLPPKSVTTFVR